ncbi:hypothetical protein BDN72DRAFT_898682 [Pluteus cervinus]|uniref:Uncharacterized protein n=1 Tax=Pluteus cervinus TaxID=181527 RepID=A0ACD3APX1_9AGAR|nr:hypothetical protein BDN72DRAFT_898682 [Pluteus cervinus]
MVSFKSLALLSVFAFGHQALAQTIVNPIPAGLCQTCIGPILASSNVLYIAPCPAGYVCCRLWTNAGMCLPVGRCPIITTLTPLPTPLLLSSSDATPFSV